MFKKVVGLLLILSFHATANMNDYFIKIDKHTEIIKDNKVYDSHDYGSAIQWNNDYAVTAKHVSFAEGSVYACSQDCDIRFIKRKSNTNKIKWRKPIPYEKVIFIGNSSGSKTFISQGKDLNIRFYMNGTKVSNTSRSEDEINTVLYSSDSSVVHGQSGGPVIATDGKVIGMIIGETQVTNIATHEKYKISLYIPYNIIKNEWKKFKKES